MAAILVSSRLRKSLLNGRYSELIMYLGTNHSRKLISDYFVNRCCWPSGGETIYHCYNISCLFNHLVDGISDMQVRLCPLGPICHLRPRIPSSRPGALWQDPDRPRLDTKCSHSILCHGFLQRRILLRPKLWQRRSVLSLPPTKQSKHNLPQFPTPFPLTPSQVAYPQQPGASAPA